MTMDRSRRRRFLRLFRVETEIQDEIDFHLEMRARQYEQDGMAQADADAAARRRFGDIDRIQAEVRVERDAFERAGHRRERWGGWARDGRHAIRQLVRHPVYTVVTIVMLALAIGVNAAIFGFVSPYFFRELPFSEPDRLLHLFHFQSRLDNDRERFSLAQLVDLRERANGFSALAAYHYDLANLAGQEGPERVQIGFLTANMFDVLGARAELGRTFAADEEGPGAAAVVVLGHGLWLRRYSGDTNIIGREIRLDGQPTTVIGVMPGDFNFPFGGVKLWAPMPGNAADEARTRTAHLIVGRLANGWTVERAATDLDRVHRELAAAFPEADGAFDGITVVGMRMALSFAWDVLRVASVALLGAVAFVLLIVCANLAGLGLARASARRREIAVRMALGASRTRLVRLMFAETLVIAMLAAAIGLILARFVVNAMGPFFPEDLYRVGEFSIDLRVLGFTLLITLAAAAMSGFAPAFSITGGRVNEALKEAGRTGAGVRTSRFRRGLVAAEVALGLLLTACAGLMVRSLAHVRDLPLGYEPENVLSVELILPEAEYAAASVDNAYDRITEAVRALPGVVAAGTVGYLPLNHETQGIEFHAGDAVPGEQLPSAIYSRISPGYIESMRIDLIGGRPFDARDGTETERVALVNQHLAERFFPRRDAIGAVLRVEASSGPLPLRIVGIVEDVRHEDVTAEIGPQIYVPLAQSSVRRRFLVVRGEADASTLAPPVREAIGTVEPELPAGGARTMQTLVMEATIAWSAMSVALGVFGLFALIIASIGLYGVIAFSVAQRRSEMGVRMALGAGARDVARLILGEAARLSATGVALGLLGTIVAGRIIASLLYGVRPGDPLTLATVVAVFMVVTLAASAVPALRAARTEPVEVLKGQQ
jgi:predicted permease